ncbi:hypothetical protein MNBD_GAMMA05-2411 [hydrothermal vent metagenome]|uniref:Uncharacterized protein n=1 Tax=hydrothermal vent metagenome TaxID=652676 RepID=A0A3B0WH12_9ZZZZ
MPDFDPKTIPTLDDVIEPVVPVVSNVENNDNEVDSILVVENEPALFSAEPVVDINNEPDMEDVKPGAPHEVSFDLAEEEEETELDLQTNPDELINEEDSENFESALIDYDAEDPIALKAIPSTDTKSLTEEGKIDEQSVTIQSPTLISETDLQSISDEIVLQLMPDLEQHLRARVQQVLKEKLPPEIIQFDTTSSTDTDE